MKVFRIAIALTLMSFPAAAEEARFFSQLKDIPVMPGLYEVVEETVSFDKPEGRIVEATAVSDRMKGTDILSFYAVSLPQLGWKAESKNSYVKDGEKLILRLESRGTAAILHVGLSPEGRNPPNPLTIRR